MSEESKLWGVSIRGWLVMVITLTACTMSMFKWEIKEPLYSAFLLCLGYYFGQKNSGSTPNGAPK